MLFFFFSLPGSFLTWKYGLEGEELGSPRVPARLFLFRKTEIFHNRSTRMIKTPFPGNGCSRTMVFLQTTHSEGIASRDGRVLGITVKKLVCSEQHFGDSRTTSCSTWSRQQIIQQAFPWASISDKTLQWASRIIESSNDLGWKGP